MRHHVHKSVWTKSSWYTIRIMENQPGVSNIVLSIAVVVLASALGYVIVQKTPAATEQAPSNRFTDALPTPLATTNNAPVPTPTVAAQPIPATPTPAPTNLPLCFNNVDALAPSVNKSTWTNFEGFGFAIKYPAESIAITSFGNPKSNNTDEPGEFGFEITSLTSPHKARILVFRLQKDTYRATYMHAPSVLYEPYSNTWWPEARTWNTARFTQCTPNPRGTTDDGKYPIYSASDGDVGMFFRNYFVMLRDYQSTDNYEPLIVQFGTAGDRNDPSFSSFGTFQSILENMIKTLEFRPTSKG